MRLATLNDGDTTRLQFGADGYLVDVDEAARILDEPAARDLPDVGAALRNPGAVESLERLSQRLDDSRLPRSPRVTADLAPPVVRPSKIVCVGLNYRLHAAEGGAQVPEQPLLFAKFPNALRGDRAAVRHPAITTSLDYEGELGVVIGRAARGVSPSDALDAVFGYTIVNDISARDLQIAESQWIRGKSLDGFAPVGPFVASRQTLPPWDQLRITTTVNGEPRQDEVCADMVFGVPELIAFISEWIELEPGDLIATGTPAGVGQGFDPPRWLQPGDEVRVEISGIGELVTTIT